MKAPTIVAEIGASHNGSLDRAIRTVRAAAAAGAHAIKLQTFTADTMVADHQATLDSGPWKGRKLHDLYTKAAMPWEWTEPLFVAARTLGMDAWSTPFDRTAIDFLEKINCPRYKIASFEITDLDLIAYAASTRKPLILSTGMATRDEIKRAIDIAADNCGDITLLKCTSAYPAPIEEMNLAMIQEMSNYTGMDVGLSDHTKGNQAAIIATALGATMIEKHITLTRAGGLDDGFAATPDEFAYMVIAVHNTVQAIGDPHYGPTPSEEPQYRLRRPPGGKRGDGPGRIT